MGIVPSSPECTECFIRRFSLVVEQCCPFGLAQVRLGLASLSLHLCPGLHAAAKIAIFCVLRKIASLTIFFVSCDFSQFFVMLIITKPDRVADLTKFAKIAKNRKFEGEL